MVDRLKILIERIKRVLSLNDLLNVELLREKINLFRDRISIDFDDQVEYIFVKNQGKKDLKVSVITPAYNREEYVSELAFSLEKQTFAEYIEWVVVDDNSTDNTLKILLNLAKKLKLGNVIILKNSRNCGVSHSLKVGVDHSTADIIAWCSSDDFYVSENKIENDYNIVKKNPNLVVFSKYILMGPNIKNITFKRDIDFLANNDNFFKTFFDYDSNLITNRLRFFSLTLFNNNILNGSSMVLHKENYYKVGGFDSYMKNDPDADIYLRLILMGSDIYFSPTKIFYRLHDKQLSNTLVFVDKVLEFSLVRIKIMQFLDTLKFNDLNLIINYLFSIINYYNENYPKNRFLFFVSKYNQDFGLLSRFYSFFYFFVYLLDRTGKINELKRIKLIDFARSDVFKEIVELSNLYCKTPAFSIFKRNFENIIK